MAKTITLSIEKQHALERGEEVTLTQGELDFLRKWTPPYVELTVTPNESGDFRVSSATEED